VRASKQALNTRWCEKERRRKLGILLLFNLSSALGFSASAASSLRGCPIDCRPAAGQELRARIQTRQGSLLLRPRAVPHYLLTGPASTAGSARRHGSTHSIQTSGLYLGSAWRAPRLHDVVAYYLRRCGRARGVREKTPAGLHDVVAYYLRRCGRLIM
jgi:hypothetical protein